MTVDEAVKRFLARVPEAPEHTPRGEIKRRIGVRQRQLFARAARLNPSYFGVCAVAPLEAGAANLLAATPEQSTGGDILYEIEAVERVVIEDPGTSSYAAGELVHLVKVTDPDVAEPPRATIRNFVLFQIGTDLEGVAKVKVHYSRRPLPIDETTPGDTELELPEPFQYLLVLDGAKDLARRELPADRAAAVRELLEPEEQELLQEFDAHVVGFVVTEGRFAGRMYE